MPMVFDFQFDENTTNICYTLRSNAPLHEVLINLADFLRASGYTITGELAVVPSIYEDSDTNDNEVN